MDIKTDNTEHKIKYTMADRLHNKQNVLFYKKKLKLMTTINKMHTSVHNDIRRQHKHNIY